MLKLIRFELNLPPNVRVTNSLAPLFHGVLMELVQKNVAAELHEESLRPFSQCIFFDKESGKNFWRIGTLTAAAYEEIVAPLIAEKKFFLRQKSWQVTLSEPKILLETSCEQLADEIFPQRNSPYAVNLQFVTPTAFKHDGRYILFPDMFFVVNSLLQRWNRFSERLKLHEVNLAVKLAEFCRVAHYKLHTRTFSLERVDLKGFCGQMNICFGGDDMTNRLLGLLFSFAPFSGVGIKTALGMGAINSEMPSFAGINT